MKIKHGGSSRVRQKKKKRGIIYREKSHAPKLDYMWQMHAMLLYFNKKHSLHYTKVFFMLYIYSMESFFIDAVAESYGKSRNTLWPRVIKPLLRLGLMDEILYSGVREDYYFQDEEDLYKGCGRGDIANRRWGLSERGRYLVSQMYQYMGDRGKFVK